MVMHEVPSSGTSGVAAHLGFTTIGVPEPEAEIEIAPARDFSDTIGTDTERRVTQTFNLLSGRGGPILHMVEQNEVISIGRVLGENCSHRVECSLRGAIAQLVRATGS